MDKIFKHISIKIIHFIIAVDFIDFELITINNYHMSSSLLRIGYYHKIYFYVDILFYRIKIYNKYNI